MAHFYKKKSLGLVAQEKIIVWAVVVAQLVERLPPTLEIRGSNPVIGKTFIKHLFTVNCVEKTKIKKKRPGMAHLKKLSCFITKHVASDLVPQLNVDMDCNWQSLWRRYVCREQCDL